jgi:uncharacterized protein
MKKVVLAGGTGFLGRHLSKGFRKSGAQVIVISRHTGDVHWSDPEAIVEALNGADLLVNLAGKSVDCRYNEFNKKEILRSRLDTTCALGEALQQVKHPPKLWINSGTATIYRHAEDRPMTEQDGEMGEGFSVNVATAWEQTFFDFQLPNTRQVVLRMAIVLGSHGGVMRPLSRLVKLGLGGYQGNGRQMFSWIHVEDIFGIVCFLADHSDLNGVFNCSAPQPVTNKELMQELRRAYKIKLGLPSPKWLLEIGAVLIRTETELVLKSRWVLPQRLLHAGYHFQYPELKTALANIVLSEKIFGDLVARAVSFYLLRFVKI